MFATLESPRFTIQDRVLEGQKAFLTWDFQFRKSNKDYLIHGGSFLQFDSAGLVVSHRDYWDSAEELLEKLPLIGIPLRWLKRRISVRTEAHPS